MARDHQITRRTFGATAMVGLAPKSEDRISGGFADGSQDWGHQLRDRQLKEGPVRRERVRLVIAGGGIAGLSAAWRLEKKRFQDYVLLELENEAGGNARSGKNEVSAYPWAAHYLPVPGNQSMLVREMCRDFGLLDGDGQWAERHLCHSPQERLFLHGRWQEGFEPTVGLTKSDAEQFGRFARQIEDIHAGGAFTIPSDEGIRKAGASVMNLDSLTMREWLQRNGYSSPYLRWYVDYGCRDDYGTSVESISAWAGVHYFASREPEEQGPLTWPEGNGWLSRALLQRCGTRIRTSSPISKIQQQGTKWRVRTPGVEYDTDFVIFAMPSFLAGYVLDPAPPPWTIDYAPWVTANITLHRWPEERYGEPAWDNVIYNSPALGYVIATHQNLGRRPDRTVWTWYLALGQGKAADWRRVLLGSDWAYWKEYILKDLERAHPDIRQCVSHIDVMRLGHAMPRPTPGFLADTERLRRKNTKSGSLVYAHSDLSGLSLFEEAQQRGVHAAEAALRYLGGSRL